VDTCAWTSSHSPSPVSLPGSGVAAIWTIRGWRPLSISLARKTRSDCSSWAVTTIHGSWICWNQSVQQQSQPSRGGRAWLSRRKRVGRRRSASNPQEIRSGVLLRTFPERSDLATLSQLPSHKRTEASTHAPYHG